MATTIRTDEPRLTLDDPLGQRSGYHEAARKALAHVDGVIEGGERWRNEPLPWTDPMFQRAVLQRLGEMRGLRREAEKLAIVKEVFGGK